MGDADIADLALFLHLPQRREMGAPIEEIVHLDQVENRALQELGRAAHLRNPRLAPAGPHLGGEKDARSRAGLGDEIAGHRLGAAIHRRGVDNLAAGIEQEAQHLGERLAGGGALANVEDLRGAEPDD